MSAEVTPKYPSEIQPGDILFAWGKAYKRTETGEWVEMQESDFLAADC